jgi:hypothetical protein
MSQFQVIFVAWACHKYVALQSARMELFALNLDVKGNTAVGLCFYFVRQTYLHSEDDYLVCARV